jgi:peptidoglycan LD-endopeptidase LytH
MRRGRGIVSGWRRRAFALVLVTVTVTGAAGSVAAVTDGQIAGAKQRLDQAQRDAHEAALQYLRAEHELARIEAKLAAIEAELPVLRAKVRAAHEAFDLNAVALYTGSTPGTEVAAGLFGAQGAMDVGRVGTLAESSTVDASSTLDDLRAAQKALEEREDDAREERVRQHQVTEEMKQLTAVLEESMRAAGKQLRRLQAQQAVEQYWAAVRRQEEARRAAEAAAAQPGAPVIEEPGRRSGPADPDAAADVPVEDLLCPVNAPVTFVNDWGQPRSGWRVHEGTDIFAARGAENVAVADGVAIMRTGGLGGNAIRLEASDGHAYYYAHFEAFEGDYPNGRREVKQGDVIGYTGNTGNAAGGPVHTHFEVHPNGGAPINPYPFLREMCAAQLGE